MLSATTRKKLSARAALLSTVGLALGLVFGFSPPPVHAGGQRECPQEGECTFMKPNLLFVVEYSTAMNQPYALDPQQSRWEAVVETLAQIAQPGSFFSQNAHLALLRYGHDPDPELVGTTIPGDSSGLVDAVALDLAWDTEQHAYLACNGQALLDALAATPPPMNGMADGIGAWTRGALEQAAVEIAQTAADHPEDLGGDLPGRATLIVALTTGAWTSADGQIDYGPPADDPVAVAGELLESGIETMVVALDPQPEAKAAADALALAGGTNEALGPELGPELGMAVEGPISSWMLVIIEGTGSHLCKVGPPRVMIMLDASSELLNVNGGLSYGAMGETPWDQVRSSLTGPGFSLFDLVLQNGFALDEVAAFGLAVFGGDGPGEQAVLGQYGPCTREGIAWALDPLTACVAPGCSDPWGGPPITWTFTSGSFDHPYSQQPFPFANHMPGCDEGTDACAGSGRLLHLGLELVAANQAEYQLAGFAESGVFRTSPDTQYLNILITGGSYQPYSTDAQVQAALEGMLAAGITTHVIGYGELAQAPATVAELEAMADWGSGGALDHHAATTTAELEQALTQIASTLEFDPCCSDWPGSCLWTQDGDTGDTGDGDTETGDTGDTEAGDTEAGDTETGDTETGDTETGEVGEVGEVGETDSAGDDTDSGSTGDGSRSIDSGEGCNCTSSTDASGPGLLLLLLLGLRRKALLAPWDAGR